MNKKYIALFTISFIALSLLATAPAFAQGGKGVMGQARGERGIVGTVASVSGNTITVTAKSRPAPNTNGTQNTTAATTIYTVDASKATVTKNGASSSVSAIAVGDTLMVQGTVTGTNVVAKTIRDGVGAPGQKGEMGIQGNGQPVVAGKVTAVSGNTITITNSSNVTYTVDATNAKFVVGGVTSPTISNVATGDNIIVQGTINGNSVVATSVIDQKAKINNGNGQGENPKPKQGGMGVFFGGIGSFFKKLFGF